MTQVSVCPPTFVFFVNKAELFHFSYKHYIENNLREIHNTINKLQIKEKKLKACFIGRQYIVREQDLKIFISKLGVKNEN